MQDPTLDKRIEDAVTRAFSAGVDGGRFIDVTRVPLICQSIVQIGKDISELKTVQAGLVTQDQFIPVKSIAYGLVGAVMTGAVGAILLLIFKH